MIELPKYPRTFHLEGSKGSKDPESIPFSQLQDKYLVIEEKMDGSMVAICFDDNANIRVFHRNQEVVGREFDQLKSWLASIEEKFFDLLDTRFILYGEWMLACHTIYYDQLPSYFIEYDIYDKQDKIWLSTKSRQQMLSGFPIVSAKILDFDRFSHLKQVTDELVSSSFISLDNKETAVLALEKAGLRRGDAFNSLDLSGLPEGLYIKHEDDFQVLGRYKYIRKEFLDVILRSGHWSKRPMIENKIHDIRR